MPDTKREQVLSVRDLDITFKTTAGPVHAIRGVNIDHGLILLIIRHKVHDC